MARVTVEDCKVQVPNRFDLVILAAQRAKQIVSGSALTIARDNDKDTVVALREIAAGSINPETLREIQTNALRKNATIENEVDDAINEVAGEEETEESIEMSSYRDNIDDDELEGFEELDFEDEKL